MKEEKSNFYSPKLAIILFLAFVLTLSFYESKKVIFWESSRETESKFNVFRSLVLSYASFAEKIKTTLGWDSFFEKENAFWLKIKKSPLIFQEAPTPRLNSGNQKKDDKKDIEIKPTPPFRTLILGDSFIAVWGGMGEILEQELINYKDVTVKREGEVSSGLSRPDYFDWPATARNLIAEQQPNVVVIMLGSNDAQSLTKNLDGKNSVLNYGTKEWDNEYGQRVLDFLEIFKENRITVFWVGLPIMRNNTYSEKMRHLNSIYEKGVKNFTNAYFISIWDLFADENGNYTDYLVDEKGKYILVRLQDGIHFSYLGGKIAVKEVIKKIGEKIKLELK